MKQGNMNRRSFLKWTGMTSAGLVLAACAAPPQSATGGEAEGQVAEPSGEATPVLFWFQAENHEPEYSTRVEELNDRFNIDFSFEILARDTMNAKFPATLMAGSGFPDILEQNAGDIVLYFKGGADAIPFVPLNDAMAESPYAGDVVESRFARFQKDGNIYGAPHDVHPLVMLYHDVAWQEAGIDLSQIQTWDEFLDACGKVDLKMADGRDRYPIMDGKSDTNLPARMMQKGFWWTDENGEPMLTDPRFKEAAEDWLRFAPYQVDRDWSNHVAMTKDGQVMTQLAPDWLYGVHKQGTADDAEWLADSPMRLTRIPDFEVDGIHTGTWGGTAVSVPKATDIGELALEVMLYLYFDNADGQLERRYVDTGILPPVVSAWEGEAFHEPEDYVGGQVAGEVFIESALDLPGYPEDWTTNTVVTAWNEQFPLVWAGEISMDEAIETADKNARDTIAQNQ
jgi:arabinosaccharide transport system substrate-binding protein